MGRDRAARIKDVARIAGVSTATVSRTLSNPDIVSKETRRSVMAAVEATGYSANLSARNLRRRQAGGVLALAPNLANPFFSEILAGMSEALAERRLNLIVADTQFGGSSQLVQYADRSRADGLLILDSRLDPAMFAGAQCPPVVQVCEEIEGLKSPRVVADNAGGAAAAVAHLVSLGHTRIARLAGPSDNSLTRWRDAGFRDGLHAASLPPRHDWHLTGDFSMESGRTAAARLLALPDRPSAIVCDNDEMACGLMSALIRSGIDIPGDIAVAGFDDIELSRHLTPTLTTVHQPRRRIGREAVRQLLLAIDGADVAERTVIPCTLVPRQSTLGRDALPDQAAS